MTDLAHILTHIITAPTLASAASRALAAWIDRLAPAAACLLVWDAELERYIVGDTWVGVSDIDPASLRRRALGLAHAAHEQNAATTRWLEPGVVFLPFEAGEAHVGALVAVGLDALPEPDALLCQVTGRALDTLTRLEHAGRIHAQLDAERARLEELLKAVEGQQRTIDRLLAAERQLSASLEAKVEERTAALRDAQQHLIQSEKLAVIGQLASSLAHELNNPLQAIQSGLGLVMCEIEGIAPERVQADLAIIQDELERIDSIFRQMLDFYRPVSYDYVPLDLNAICEGVRVLMRKRLQERRVDIHLELAASLPLTCGDSNQIKQVLLNLVLNAAEAMDGHGGTITLHTRPASDRVCLAVHDDGPGIAPEHRARLFEPLFTTKPRGLGLGLAISQEIIQRHDGQIVVDSAPGAGTTFTIQLPVRATCHEHR